MSISDEAVEAAREAAHGTAVIWKWSEMDRDEELRFFAAALEAAAPHLITHVHHHDIEHHARSFNEGFETAIAQELATDPALASDWLDEKLREARAGAWDECEAAKYEIRLNPESDAWESVKPNPYRTK